MAKQNLWKTTELMPLLKSRGINLSESQVYRLVTSAPERIPARTFAALCDILDCTPNDLFLNLSWKCAPQRQRTPRNAAKTSASVRELLFASTEGTKAESEPNHPSRSRSPSCLRGFRLPK